MKEYKVLFNDMQWQSLAKGVRSKSFVQGNRKLRLVEFSKGFIEEDWCAKGHIGYVLEGALKVDFSGEMIEFRAGDGVFIPAGAEHKHKASVITDTATLILTEDA